MTGLFDVAEVFEEEESPFLSEPERNGGKKEFPP